MRDTKITEKLCNTPLDPNNPKSPRCVVPKDDHAGKPHRGLKSDGSIVEWGRN